MREALRKDIDDMLRMRVIRQSDSSYAFPVVIVKKTDGSNRICIDYRKLNKITVVDPEPMTPMTDLFQDISRDRFFSQLDLSKGYWQIPVAERDIEKTAFITADGQYEFLKMPFGMINSGATLARSMKKLLKDLDQVSHFMDILVHTPTWEGHLTVLRKLFERMAVANLTVRPTKCSIGRNRIILLGQEVGQGIRTPPLDGVEKVRDASQPATKKGLRSFLGLTGFYRDHIPNYAAVAAPLTDMLRKGQPNKLSWGDSQERAYSSLKQAITGRPILCLPDHDKDFVLRTDACDTGIGAVLLQEQGGKLHPVAFASRKLAEREKKFSTIERECLSIVWSVRNLLFIYTGSLSSCKLTMNLCYICGKHSF